MVSLKWEEKFSVGVDEIDEQHKQLFNLINEVRDSIKKGQTKDFVIDCIQKLDKYASFHFDLEEKYMIENRYPNIEEHRLEHKNFITGIKNIKENLDPGKLITTYNLLDFLINWITFHILESDKEYAYYINGNK